MDSHSMQETVNGVIENVVYKNDINDYIVLEISFDDNLITAVGNMPMAFEGELVTLFGSWVYHREFGKQFAFENYEKMLPTEEEGILRYLSSRTIKGVGPITALKIVNKFGADSFDVIENHPEWLTDISGITRKKAASISESFREQSGIRSVMMFCSEYMTSAEVMRVYKKKGANSLDAIKQNPYILCDEEFSIPFDKADSIAKTLNVPQNSFFRILSGLKYVLSYNASANGHTCLPAAKLIEAGSELLGVPADEVRRHIEIFLSDKELHSYKIEDVEYVMADREFSAEKYIAEKLNLVENSVQRFAASDVRSILENAETRFGIEYATLQKNAIYEALNSGVMILTGGPGTGKTTVVKALISIFSNLGMKYALCAPTGRATKRLSESTSCEAKTIHRLLEMEKNSLRELVFHRNAKNPLEESVIIVDESSMIDLLLFESLLRAMRPGARIILIGDADQLPSVGAGNVFSDLIASEKIKTVRLTEIFRQAKESLIVTNAHKINNGESPILNSTDKDFFFVRRENEREIPTAIAELIIERLPRAYGSRIKEQIQIITPSKKGAGGVEILNSELQARLNPPAKFKREKMHRGVIFREGDKVMQTANNYDIEWKRGDNVGFGIFNGDVGKIETINNMESYIVIRFDDRVVEYPFDNLAELDLAYAITVHKSQGSEYPVVIIPTYNCPPMLLTRNLLYTAITRARNMVILVGRSDIPAVMVANKREVMRYTTLKKRIIDFYN